MKFNKTSAALIGVVVTLVLLVAPTASAHTPSLSVSLDCNGKVSWTFGSDGFAAHFTITDSVSGQQGGTMTLSGPNYSKSGSYTVSTSVTSGTVTANINWDDGYQGAKTISRTYTRPSNCKSSPSISTSASGPVAVGSAINDVATLTGTSGTPNKSTVTFNVYASTDTNCGTPLNTSPIAAVSNTSAPNPTYTSGGYTPANAGSYKWIATFAGDTNNNAVAGHCNDANETSVVQPKQPTIATTLSSSTITVGGTVHDSSTLSGATSNAGGTVTYTVYANTGCTQGGQNAGTASVTNGVVGNSNPITFNSVGDYYWQAVYNGDANNKSATSPCTDEHLVVGMTTPSVATALSASQISVGAPAHDTATLSGVTPTAGGTVTYTVYTDTSCTQGAQAAGTKTVTNGIVPSSDTLTFNTSGDYYWQASYSGDSNNGAARSACTDEHLVVNQKATGISTSLSAPTVTVGGTVHDSATLTGMTSSAGGSVTYTVYSNNECTGTPQDGGTKTVTNAVVPDSNPITFNTSGDYYWQASYTGDQNNKAATSPCTDEHLVVGKTAPSVSTTLSPSTISVGGTAHDSATLTGVTSDAGGTVTYSVYSNGECTGEPQSAGTKTVTNHIAPDSDPITFNTAGDYYWQVSYSGDANNGPTTSACTDEHLVVNKATPTIATTLSASTITAGGTVNDTSKVTGATGNAGGTVTYTVFTNTVCTTGAVDAGTKTVSNGVVPNSNTLTFSNAGDYYWQASYSGDANNAAATSACTSEHLVVNSPPPPPSTPQSPAISITKNPKSQTIQTGSTASFTITVTNTGNVTLTNVTVSDPLSPDCSKTSANIGALASMAQGASVTYNCSLANVTSNFTNVATANGTPPSGPNVSASDSAPVTVTVTPPPSHPAITIAKDPKLQAVDVGGTATFKITVTNTGNVTLTSVTVDDPLSPNCSKSLGTLAVGQASSYSCTKPNVQKSFRNVASVTGTPPSGPNVTGSDHADVTASAPFTPPKPKQPKIDIVKSPKSQTVTTKVTSERSTTGATKTSIVYSSAHFTIKVTNTGQVTLHNVVVTDPKSKDCERQLGTLAPGASHNYQCVRDVVSSGFTNVALVTGSSPTGQKVHDSDHAVVKVQVREVKKVEKNGGNAGTKKTAPFTPPKTTGSASPAFTG
jgi:uncharacterized repeat protein (TIGR01451 family)